MMSGRFTLTDMLQMEMMARLAPWISRFHTQIYMFGGMGNLSTKQKKQMQNNLKFRIIMDSMTQKEG